LTTFGLEKDKRKNVPAYASGVITFEEMESLPVRLGCLALNLYDARQENGIDLEQAVVWLLYRRREPPHSYRNQRKHIPKTAFEFPPIQITLEERVKAETLIKLAVELGFLVKEDEALSFFNEAYQEYFCAVYCMSYPINNDILNRIPSKVWYFWSDLDLNLAEKAWQFIKDANEDEEHEASSLLLNVSSNGLWQETSLWSEITSEEIVTLLIEGLKDPGSFVRDQAASTLESICSPRASEPLMAVLHDSNPKVRANAANGLGKLEEKRAVRGLIELLDDENGKVRQQAVYALSYIRDSAAVEPLIGTLLSGGFADVAAASVLGYFKDSRAVEPLIEALEFDYTEMRAYAAKSLGEIGDKRAIEPLARLLKDEEERVRFMAAYGLGMLGDKRGFRLLIESISIEPEKRKHGRLHGQAWRAAEALGNIGDRRAVKPLLDALPNGSETLRQEIALSLGKLGDPLAIEPLIGLLGDSAGSVRVEAVRALGQLAAETALPELEEMALNDEGENWDEVTVKEAALGAIEEIEKTIKKRENSPNFSLANGKIDTA
jgi:HEAT repeat protein